MHQDEVKAIFDKTAATYDKQWEKMAPLGQTLHLLMGAIFADLPENANILCVGAGTGSEILYLAQVFPGWTFTAVDPSAAMLAVCRQRLDELGLEGRCTFHTGYLDSLQSRAQFHAATSILVSQFILSKTARIDFFRGIAKRLNPGGFLVTSDLSADLSSPVDQDLMEVWLQVMKAGNVDSEVIEQIRIAYSRDVGVLPADEVANMIASGGFETPIHAFQAGLIHGWYSKKAGS